MIDLHCHVLPGIDDGPESAQEAIELARGAMADGISTIVATPHVDASHPEVRAGVIQAAVPAFQARLERAGVRVKIETGAEVAFTRALDLDDAELRALTLGRGGWLLLECPLNITSTPGFLAAARQLACRGHRILLAHPERCPLFLREPDELSQLIAEGMLAQVTARSLGGRFGRTVRTATLHLLARGSVHVIASDGHDANRPARIAGHLRSAGLDPGLIAWLTREVPGALLSGADLPAAPRPARGRPRRRLTRMVGLPRAGESPVKYK